MTLPYDGLSANFEKYMVNWFEATDDLEFILELYALVIYNPSLYVQLRFFNLISAIEGFYNRKFRTRKLKNILKELFDTYSHLMSRVLNNDTNQDSLIDHIVDLRLFQISISPVER